MSFFKRVLSSVGIGAANVDTVLQQAEWNQGDTLQAEVHVRGGQVEQAIDQLYFAIKSEYEATVLRTNELEDGEIEYEEEEITRTATIASITIAESFVLAPDEQKTIPVSLPIPHHTPLSFGKHFRVWIETGLDIKRALDPGDTDELKICAGPLVMPLFEALESLGFVLGEVENEEVESHGLTPLPFVQEFEFKATAAPFSGAFEELELFFVAAEDHVEVFMEIDRRSRGIRGLFHQAIGREDESRLRFTYGADDIDELAPMLEQILLNEI